MSSNSPSFEKGGVLSDYRSDQISNADNKYDVDVLNGEKKVDIKDFIRETRPWYRVPHLRQLTFSIFIITLASTNSGFDGSLLNGLQSLEDWNVYLGYPTGQKLGAISNGYTFGCILSVPFAPYISDRFGRVKTMLFGSFWVAVGGILQGATTASSTEGAYGMFLAARIIMGFGGALAALAAPALLSEIAYPTHREASTFSYNICWYLGATIVAIITYFTKDISTKHLSWRIPCFLQAFFPVVQLAFFFVLPESPRYLIAKGKIAEAEKLLRKIHTGNSEDPRDIELVRFEMAEIEAALEAERLAGANSRYTDFWTQKTYRKRLFLVIFTAIFMQLSGNGLVSYYLSKVLASIGYTKTEEQLKINMLLMAYNFIVCCVVCAVCSRFKRRTLFLTCVIGMFVSYIVWTALSAINEQRNFEQKSLGQGVLAMIFLYYLSYNIGANGLPFVYVTEILPYSHRSKGLNVFMFTMQVVLVYNGYVNPIAMDAISWKYYIVYCCILAVEIVVIYFTYPETSGRTLEEVAEVFGDSSNPNAAAFANVVEKRNSVEHVETA